MNDTDTPVRPYIDLLRDDLADYEARKLAAQEKLADQPEYIAKVLAQLDRGIAIVLAKIAREEEAHAPTVQS